LVKKAIPDRGEICQGALTSPCAPFDKEIIAIRLRVEEVAQLFSLFICPRRIQLMRLSLALAAAGLGWFLSADHA
jgi:hypothetical protein